MIITKTCIQGLLTTNIDNDTGASMCQHISKKIKKSNLFYMKKIELFQECRL